MQPSLLLFPTFGALDEAQTTWAINIHGAVYEPREIRLRRKILIRWLRQAVGTADADFDSGILDDRLRDFVAATRRGRRILVQVGARQLELTTQRNGHFSSQVCLSASEVARLLEQKSQNGACITLAANSEACDAVHGRVHLVPRAGTSVISDIDDTIKHTEVIKRRELLRNTFLREFQSIEGMAQLYRSWSDQGAMFHFVSGSVWQLYRPLRELLDRDGFPEGSFHLRTLRFRRAILKRLLRMSRTSKLAQIRSIVAGFPNRRFLLVGDSGQQDPEVYAQIAREFPSQVDKIIIREVASLAGTSRLRELMDGTASGIWQVFREPSELSDVLSPKCAIAPGERPS